MSSSSDRVFIHLFLPWSKGGPTKYLVPVIVLFQPRSTNNDITFVHQPTNQPTDQPAQPTKVTDWIPTFTILHTFYYISPTFLPLLLSRPQTEGERRTGPLRYHLWNSVGRQIRFIVIAIGHRATTAYLCFICFSLFFFLFAYYSGTYPRQAQAQAQVQAQRAGRQAYKKVLFCLFLIVFCMSIWEVRATMGQADEPNHGVLLGYLPQFGAAQVRRKYGIVYFCYHTTAGRSCINKSQPLTSVFAVSCLLISCD